MEVLKKFCISPECVCGLRFKRDVTKDLFLHYQVHLYGNPLLWRIQQLHCDISTL